MLRKARARRAPTSRFTVPAAVTAHVVIGVESHDRAPNVDSLCQLSSSMNALQDPTKKPSINSLLNPQESLAHPVGTNHGQNQSSQASSMFQYGSVPSYHLRAASWDADDDPHKRRFLNGAHNADRQYATLPPTPLPHNYGDVHASRLMMRPRIDESSMYIGEGQVWQPKHPHQQHQQQQQQHQHAVSGMSYPPVLYSDERAGILIS